MPHKPAQNGCANRLGGDCARLFGHVCVMPSPFSRDRADQRTADRRAAKLLCGQECVHLSVIPKKTTSI